MPPKPRPIRKPSTAGKNLPLKPVAKEAEKGKQAAAAMPPPPQPGPPKAILEPEMAALTASLKAATVKTAQIYGFYADTRRLGLSHQARYPPRSLTIALGHEVETYDQLCDAIESQLHRAIAILQRDLTREEQRLKAKATAVSSRTRSKTPSSSPTVSRVPLPPVAGSSSSPPLSTSPPNPQSASMPPPSGDASPFQFSIGDQMSPPNGPSATAPGRRASVISLSTLQRPFPLKLDLSSSALRIGADEFMHPLASPVTLAPRSARPSTAGGDISDMPPDLMAMVNASGVPMSGSMSSRPVDIDLTMAEQGPVQIDLTMPESQPGREPNLGSSADKPIELDLDMEVEMHDLFGDDAPSDGTGGPGSAEDNDILQTLSAVGNTGDARDIFASLASDDTQTELSNSENQASTSTSDGLADFNGQPSSGPSEATAHEQFDLGGLDLTNLGPAFFEDEMSMDDILKMSGEDRPA